MLISFDEIIDITLHHEGGYVHDPKDLGGETNYGIAKRFYPDVDIKNLTESEAKDILYTPFFTGVSGNYLKPSILAAGLDPKDVMTGDKSLMDFGSNRKRMKTWKDIWGAGQGVGGIESILPTSQVVKKLTEEYVAAQNILKF